MIYFAHSKLIYNTPLEKKILSFLRKELGKVICPNNDMGELGAVEPYLKKVEISDKVVVHEFRGYIGRDCYEEVKRAFQKNIPVLAIRGKKLVSIKGAKIINPYDWKVFYAKLNH